MKKFLLGLLVAGLVLVSSVAEAARRGTLTTNTTVEITNMTGGGQSGLTNTLYLTGTFGGGTVIVQASPDNGVTWITVPNSSYTAAVVTNVGLRYTKIRLSLSGATTPSISWWMVGE